MLYANLDDRALAEKYFQATIDLEPLTGYENRGITYLWQWDEPSLAAADFDQALQLDPENPRRYHDLGQAQLLAGDTATALETYKTLLPLPDNNADLRSTIRMDLEILKEDDPGLGEVIDEILLLL